MTLLGMHNAYKPLATAQRRSKAVKHDDHANSSDDDHATAPCPAHADAGATGTSLGVAW